MASGKAHDFSILCTSPVVLVAGGYYFGWELGIIAGSSYFLGGWLLSPDLDLKSRPWKRWGVLRVLWLPYQRIPHRHWLSHGVLVGSVGRVLYTAVLLIPLWVLFPGLAQVNWALTWEKVAAFLIGNELSALNHLLLDGLLIPLPKSVKGWLKK
jgi:uncharacterized metal-binding protein